MRPCCFLLLIFVSHQNFASRTENVCNNRRQIWIKCRVTKTPTIVLRWTLQTMMMKNTFQISWRFLLSKGVLKLITKYKFFWKFANVNNITLFSCRHADESNEEFIVSWAPQILSTFKPAEHGHWAGRTAWASVSHGCPYHTVRGCIWLRTVG